jgi:hypothetical protein
MGVSPRSRHSHALLVLAFKAALYAILLGCAWLAARGLRQRRASKRVDRADALLLAAVAVYILQPLTPDIIDNAWLGGRLLAFAWLFMIMAASRGPLSAGERRYAIAGALVAFALTMIPAQLYMRRLAKQIAQIGTMQIPTHQYGFLLIGPALPHMDPQLGFGAGWAPMLAMMHSSDIPVNSPWLEQIYYVVKPQPDPKLMINLMPTDADKHAMDMNHGVIFFLPPDLQDKLLADADFLLTEGFDPSNVGRIGILSASQSAPFVCQDRVAGMQVCTRKTTKD